MKSELIDLEKCWQSIVEELKKGDYKIATLSAYILYQAVQQYGTEQTALENR